jgi:peptidoglycan hydrolase CwlO-like protein
MGEYARLNGNLKSWQEDYYQKTQHNHKQVFMEIDRLNEEIADINIRIKKNTDTGASNLAKIVSLENANAKVEELTKDIQKVIDKYDLEI